MDHDVVDFDPLTITATDLKSLLDANVLTSVEIVERYLLQIERHNRKGRQLRALISVAPRYNVLGRAKQLDEERARGKTRGPFHGIPIVVKDNIMTEPSLGMDTTVGSYAFVGAKPKKNAPIIDQLIQGGLIVIGKANLTEFCGLRTPNMMPGWSSVGGQTQSIYIPGGIEPGETILGHSAPGGCSTGSAVAVAAGFAPLALGTETVGSIITPASRSALYAIKLTVGEVPMDGIFGLSKTFDSVGAMAKSAADLETLVKVLTKGSSNRDSWDSGIDMTENPWERNWCGLRIGFADPAIWKLDEESCRPDRNADEEMEQKYEAAIEKIRDRGAAVNYPVEIPLPENLSVDDADGFEMVAYHEFKDIANKFMAGLEKSKVRSISDIIKYNADHAHLALPALCSNQDDLIAVRDHISNPEWVSEVIDRLKLYGADHGIDKVLSDHDLDIIAAPADSGLCCFAAAAGYPIATVPLSTIRLNGRPFGIALTTRSNDEHKLFQFVKMWEATFPDRPKPSTHFRSPNRRSPPLLPDAPIVNLILREWDSREWSLSSDALTEWLNARWRKSGYSVSQETVYQLLKRHDRIAFRGIVDESEGAFTREQAPRRRKQVQFED
ncbi:amidase signature enzyme [Patellaria atrata CBS 101060]|uniref:Amidase signature enzyme n=1 Tax=Patellaria atrata CBS 101060 TaxID=1346257 RepID=A0A9P4S2F5_9PEZI|nr:amidase signature enzyme [Patellaria atrata CBS 101060]